MELISRAKDGNKSALNTLLQDNYKILFGFIIKMTANDTIAQDITQDTLLKAVLNFNKFKGKCKFSTWLIQISINTYKDYLKKNKASTPIDNFTPSEISRSTEDETISKLLYKEALEELKNIPYKQRTAFILKHYYGYSLEEIAHIMKCPKGTVKSRISNCSSYLREALQ
jgi:RNA polymerase sigma-70 factor (ECF subfamily)